MDIGEFTDDYLNELLDKLSQENNTIFSSWLFQY